MTETYCRLDNGEVAKYIAAFPVHSVINTSPELIYIGKGLIIRVDDKLYHGKTRLKFYTTFKRVKYNGKARR